MSCCMIVVVKAKYIVSFSKDLLCKRLLRISVIRGWTNRPYRRQKSLLAVQSLRVFENIFKVWTDNVPVEKDASAMAEMRGHRIRLARASTSAPDVVVI